MHFTKVLTQAKHVNHSMKYDEVSEIKFQQKSVLSKW